MPEPTPVPVQSPKRRTQFAYYAGALLLALVVNVWLTRSGEVTIDYSDFHALLAAGAVRDVTVAPSAITGTAALAALREQVPAAVAARLPAEAAETARFRTLRVDDPGLIAELEARQVRYAATAGSGWLTQILMALVSALVFVVLWALVLGRMGNRQMGDLVGIGKSRARVYVQKNIDVRFADVEGIDEAKAELVEVVEFLRTPARYTRLGGHIPKGVLIVGAPGTGKTLLARAVAGEAGVPFLSISGSEFVEMFVGVGAARVRDLFDQAQKLAPCIIFIDELDALGKARGVGGFGGQEEREQTLNQLLVELDGFDTNKGVIIMAATNRPEILDPALLRPGRFDRKIAIDRPDIRGRERILRLHARRLVLERDVDLAAVAARTPGFAGADLANLVNEAALHAARHDQSTVMMADFEAAIDRVMTGLEKKNRVINPREKQTVACHEAGHALIAELRPTTDKVAKVSIIPRGIGALGFTMQQPTEDRYLMKRSELLDRLDVLLAGRVAEQLVFGEVSTGAQDDLQRATDLARHMVAQNGMSERIGPAVVDTRPAGSLLGDLPALSRRECSEETARQIDLEVERLLRDAEARVHATLVAVRPRLDALAQVLLERETVGRDTLVELLEGPGSRLAAPEDPSMPPPANPQE